MSTSGSRLSIDPIIRKCNKIPYIPYVRVLGNHQMIPGLQGSWVQILFNISRFRLSIRSCTKFPIFTILQCNSPCYWSGVLSTRFISVHYLLCNMQEVHYGFYRKGPKSYFTFSLSNTPFQFYLAIIL